MVGGVSGGWGEGAARSECACAEVRDKEGVRGEAGGGASCAAQGEHGGSTGPARGRVYMRMEYTPEMRVSSERGCPRASHEACRWRHRPGSMCSSVRCSSASMVLTMYLLRLGARVEVWAAVGVWAGAGAEDGELEASWGRRGEGERMHK